MSVANTPNLRLPALRRWLFCGLLPALCCLLPQRIAAGPVDGAALSQRRINELAAALQRARLALIEETGLRRPQEPLPAYFLRMAGVVPGETDQARTARIGGYIATLTAVKRDTASLRAAPTLQHNDPANQQQWQRAINALHLLPARIRQVRATWQSVQRDERRNWQSPNPILAAASYRRLGAELTQAVETILVAYNALRDARP